MKDETTNRLAGILKEVESKEAALEFSKNHSMDYGKLHNYINDYIVKSGVDIGVMIEKSGISTNYVYNILNGRTKKPGRDKVLALCIGVGMNLDEINRGLQIAGHNRLYPKNPRDIYISYCINKGLKDVTLINLELEEHGLGLIEV